MRKEEGIDADEQIQNLCNFAYNNVKYNDRAVASAIGETEINGAKYQIQILIDPIKYRY